MNHLIERVTFGKEMMTLHLNDSVVVLPIRIEYTARFGRGVSLHHDEYNALLHVSRKYMCKKSALMYLGRAIRSEEQIRRNLLKKQYDADMIEHVLMELVHENLINDELYCEVYLKSLARRKVVGRIYAESMLQKKGVNAQLVRDVAQRYEYLFDDRERIFDLACRKYTQIQDKPHRYARLAASLARLGFPSRIIVDIIEKMKHSGYTFD